jgi:hypothetical protein
MNPKTRQLLILIAVVVIAILVIAWFSLQPSRVNVQADFHNRSGGAVIPALYFGVGAVGSTMTNAEAIRNITTIHLYGNRLFAQVDQIYPNDPNTPIWNGANAWIDDKLERATRDGLSPIIVLQGTPPYLGAKSCSMPSDLAAWGKLAANVAAHFEAKHPGLNYEIWNEPDAEASFCPIPPTSNTGQPAARDKYLQLYATVAPLVKAAAPTGKVGGPTLAAPGPNSDNWFPAFLSGATAPYVDFVSFHLYVTGQWDIDQGMDWNYLYNITQSPTQGIGYYARKVDGYVRKGSQPNAATTPIYLTEYNSNWAFKPTCCQNDPVYGPLWNAVAMDQLWNMVNDGAAKLLSRLVYYAAANSADHFCLMGKTGTDCGFPGSDVPGDRFPTFAFYELLTSPNYLNLNNGMTVLPRPTAPEGMLATEFYTATGDGVLLVNPTDKNYAAVTVKMANSGLQNMSAVQYSLERGMLLREPQRIALDSSNTVTLTAHVPAYSTVALSLVQADQP